MAMASECTLGSEDNVTGARSKIISSMLLIEWQKIEITLKGVIIKAKTNVRVVLGDY